MALPEEGMKLLVVLMACGRRLRELASRRLFVTAIAAGGGFALLENVLFVVGQLYWAIKAILRSISAVPGHVFVGGAVMGLCLIKASRGPQCLLWWVIALLLPIVLHSAYDYYLFELSDASARAQARDMMNFFALAFIMIMLIEAALAHFDLIALMCGEIGTVSRGEPGAVGSPRFVSGYRQPSRLQCPSWQRRCLNAVMPHRVTWAFLGSLWLAAGVLLLWRALTGQGFTAETQNVAFELGIAVIAGVDAVAFFALVVIPRCGNRVLPQKTGGGDRLRLFLKPFLVQAGMHHRSGVAGGLLEALEDQIACRLEGDGVEARRPSACSWRRPHSDDPPPRPCASSCPSPRFR